MVVGYFFFIQFKSLFEIFTFVSERNTKYQYFILASLILVTCYINSVSRFSTIQLRLINKFNTDFESYLLSVSNFRLVRLLPIYTIVFDPRVGGYEKSKMLLFFLFFCFFLSILYMELYYYPMQRRKKYTLFPKLILKSIFFIFCIGKKNPAYIKKTPCIIIECCEKKNPKYIKSIWTKD